MKITTKKIVICSLFVALMSIFAQISIPLGFTPVPINLGPMIVLLCGAILGSKLGALSMLIYLMIGAIGAPVFANFSGSFGIIIGPTGGYIIGYIACAFIVGILIEKLSFTNFTIVISMILGMIACYTIGTIWFMIITKTELVASITLCVLPFIPGEILKIIAATSLTKKLRPILNKKLLENN